MSKVTIILTLKLTALANKLHANIILRQLALRKYVRMSRVAKTTRNVETQLAMLLLSGTMPAQYSWIDAIPEKPKLLRNELRKWNAISCQIARCLKMRHISGNGCLSKSSGNGSS